MSDQADDRINDEALAALKRWLPVAAEGLERGRLSNEAWSEQAMLLAARYGLSLGDGSWFLHVRCAWDSIKGR